MLENTERSKGGFSSQSSQQSECLITNQNNNFQSKYTPEKKIGVGNQNGYKHKR